MMCLHQAQTSVGRSRRDVIAFFMCVTLDEQESATFKKSAAPGHRVIGYWWLFGMGPAYTDGARDCVR
jgi:hypothetical protein